MNINSSMNSVYSSNMLSGRVTTSANSTETEEMQKSAKGAGGQGTPPPPKSGGKGPQVDSNGDNTWDMDELSSYAEYSTNELGVELDAESLLTEYDEDEDGVLNSSEIKSLASNNGLQLQKASRNATPEMQSEIMTQMQSTATVNITDFLTVEEDEEEDTINSINLESTTLNIEDFLIEDEEESEDEISTISVEDNKEYLKSKMLAAYSAPQFEEESVYFAV